MANDLEIIKRLEMITGKKLKKIDTAGILVIDIGFAIDSNQNVTGLNLYKSNLQDISFLKDLEHLTHLYLISNQISDLSPLKELNALNYLGLDSPGTYTCN